MFESFLANKFAAAKRFGLEGCETLIPGMKALIDRSTDMGVDSIVMGMPHRGTFGMPFAAISMIPEASILKYPSATSFLSSDARTTILPLLGCSVGHRCRAALRPGRHRHRRIACPRDHVA